MYEAVNIMGKLYLVKMNPTNGQISIVATFNGSPDVIRQASEEIAAACNAALGLRTGIPQAIGIS